MTTPVQNRWWAPKEPGIGPDDFDLDLLEPGDDPSADLGQAFLALHRVGAAACEAVATEPLADESTLAFALANARALVAPEAKEIVAKAVGDDENYGNLLIRDMLDDAEGAALSLWRSCIAKSVPAPVAAQRVGMVYGLPAGALFAFQKAATDTKSSPAALTDLADRALFTHLAQLVKEEAVDRKVEVSKMTTDEWNRTEAGSKHPKNPANGRFAQIANKGRPTIAGQDVSSWLASQMTAAPAEVATPATEPPRLGRPNKPNRPNKPRRPRPAAEVSAGVSSGVSSGTSAGTSAKVSALMDAWQLSQALDADRPPNPLLDVTHNLSRTPRKPGEVTLAFPEQPMTLEYIPHQLAYVLPTDEAMAFERAGEDGEIGRLFRAGRLTNYAGDPEVFRDEDDQLTETHKRNVAAVVELLSQDPDVQRQPPKQVRYVDKTALDQDDFAGSVDAAKADFLSGLGLSPSQVSREIVHVADAVNIDDPNQVALVYSPPPADRTQLANRPVIEVTELILNDEDLYGHREGPHGSKHEQWVPDRNQVMTFYGPLGVLGSARFWDNELQAFRTWRHAGVSDEDVSKAMTPEQFRRAETKGVENRDAQGHFIGHVLRQLEEQGMTAVPVAAPRRANKPNRPNRPRRPAPASSMSAGVSAGISSGTTSSVEARTTSVRDSMRVEAVDIPSLVPGDYTALPYTMQLDPLGFHRKLVNPEMRTEIRQHGVEDEYDVEGRVLGAHHDEHVFENRPETKVFSFEDISPDDIEYVAGAIYEEMEKDNNFTVAHYTITMTGEGTANVTVARNRRPMGPRDVIRWPGNVRPSQLRALYPAERMRLQNLKSIRGELMGGFASAEATGADDNYVLNPWVRVWDASED